MKHIADSTRKKWLKLMRDKQWIEKRIRGIPDKEHPEKYLGSEILLKLNRRKLSDDVLNIDQIKHEVPLKPIKARTKRIPFNPGLRLKPGKYEFSNIFRVLDVEGLIKTARPGKLAAFSGIEDRRLANNLVGEPSVGAVLTNKDEGFERVTEVLCTSLVFSSIATSSLSRLSHDVPGVPPSLSNSDGDIDVGLSQKKDKDPTAVAVRGLNFFISEKTRLTTLIFSDTPALLELTQEQIRIAWELWLSARAQSINPDQEKPHSKDNTTIPEFASTLSKESNESTINPVATDSENPETPQAQSGAYVNDIVLPVPVVERLEPSQALNSKVEDTMAPESMPSPPPLPMEVTIPDSPLILLTEEEARAINPEYPEIYQLLKEHDDNNRPEDAEPLELSTTLVKQIQKCQRLGAKWNLTLSRLQQVLNYLEYECLFKDCDFDEWMDIDKTQYDKLYPDCKGNWFLVEYIVNPGGWLNLIRQLEKNKAAEHEFSRLNDVLEDYADYLKMLDNPQLAYEATKKYNVEHRYDSKRSQNWLAAFIWHRHQMQAQTNPDPNFDQRSNPTASFEPIDDYEGLKLKLREWFLKSNTDNSDPNFARYISWAALYDKIQASGKLDLIRALEFSPEEIRLLEDRTRNYWLEMHHLFGYYRVETELVECFFEDRGLDPQAAKVRKHFMMPNPDYAVYQNDNLWFEAAFYAQLPHTEKLKLNEALQFTEEEIKLIEERAQMYWDDIVYLFGEKERAYLLQSYAEDKYDYTLHRFI